MRHAMIMAGGSGTRLWPMSRAAQPKQLLPLIAGRSLLELSAARLEGVVPASRRYVCAGESYRGAIRAALPEFEDGNILGEPVGRDTLNAVGLGAAVIGSRDPDAVFAVLTSDHLIEPQEEFARRLDVGFRLVEADHRRFVTFAIRPTFPATGYGYVQRGEPIEGFDRAFMAQRFVEKPDLARATEYLASGTFGWNSGMFVFSASQVMEALRWFKPESCAGLTEIAAAWNTSRRQAVIERVYPTLPKISVDFALMEPAAKDQRLQVCVVPMDLAWMDVGSWPTYAATLSADAAGNRANCASAHLDSKGVLAVSDDPDHTITTIGCENLIIVHTADATLVCRADQAERVKELAGAVAAKLR